MHPSYSDEIENNIKTLTQLKYATEKDIDLNNTVINSGLETANETKSNEVAEINPDDFTSTEGKEKIESLENEIVELNEINAELTELETLKENETSEKAIKKIDKKIEKITLKQAKVENELIGELATINRNELAEKQSEISTSETKAKSSGVIRC